jgi:hypothetical protein
MFQVGGIASYLPKAMAGIAWTVPYAGGTNSNGANRNSTDPGFAAVVGNTVLLTATIGYNAGYSTAYARGRSRLLGQSAVFTAYNSLNTDAPQVCIGGETTSFPFKGDISEIIVFDRVLTDEEIDSLGEYQAAKYIPSLAKTVGAGGDFSTWFAAQTWLKAQGIIRDYTFTQLSDVSESSAAVAINVDPSDALSVFSIEYDGSGYITRTNVASLLSLSSYLVLSIHDFKMLSTYAGATPGVLVEVSTVLYRGTEIYNCSFASTGGTAVSGIDFGSTANLSYASCFKVYNCMFYNMNIAIAGNASGTHESKNYPGYRFIENCSLFNCGKGINKALILEWVYTAYIAVKNVYFIRNDGITGQDVDFLDATCTMANCFTTDATTFATIAAAYPTQITDCTDGVLPAQLASVVYGEADFMKPAIGSGLASGGLAPSFSLTDFFGVAYDSPYPVGASEQPAIILKVQPVSTIFIAVNSDKAFALGNKVLNDRDETKLQITNYKARSDYQDVLHAGG